MQADVRDIKRYVNVPTNIYLVIQGGGMRQWSGRKETGQPFRLEGRGKKGEIGKGDGRIPRFLKEIGEIAKFSREREKLPDF